MSAAAAGRPLENLQPKTAALAQAVAAAVAAVVVVVEAVEADEIDAVEEEEVAEAADAVEAVEDKSVTAAVMGAEEGEGKGGALVEAVEEVAGGAAKKIDPHGGRQPNPRAGPEGRRGRSRGRRRPRVNDPFFYREKGCSELSSAQPLT